jgi:hypothetical protein
MKNSKRLLLPHSQNTARHPAIEQGITDHVWTIAELIA